MHSAHYNVWQWHTSWLLIIVHQTTNTIEQNLRISWMCWYYNTLPNAYLRCTVHMRMIVWLDGAWVLFAVQHCHTNGQLFSCVHVCHSLSLGRLACSKPTSFFGLIWFCRAITFISSSVLVVCAFPVGASRAECAAGTIIHFIHRWYFGGEN